MNTAQEVMVEPASWEPLPYRELQSVRWSVASSLPRIASLEALRAGAMLLVVLAHAALAYVEIRIPGLVWVIRDHSRSLFFDVLFWGCVGTAMPIFFTLSGLWAVQLFDLHGSSGYFRDRSQRILLPFLAAGLIVLPITLVVWGIGWLASGQYTWSQIIRMKVVKELLKNQWLGPAHLWFLEYLLVMLFIYGVVQSFRSRSGRVWSEQSSSRWDGWLLAHWSPFLIAIPSTLILASGYTHHGFDPMTDLRNSFVPDPYRWAHHAWFFVVGTLLARRRSQWNALQSRWRSYLAFAALVLVVRLALLRDTSDFPGSRALHAVCMISGALFGWLALFGLWGAAQQGCVKSRGVIAYLSGASYWVYLVHFPMVGLVQVALYPAPWPAGIKYVVVVSLVFLLCLASYETVVRRTWVGRWLNGRRLS